jgi:hypothetical protein
MQKERQESSRGGKVLKEKEIGKIDALKEFGSAEVPEEEDKEMRSGWYSRAMIRKNIEVVNTLNRF